MRTVTIDRLAELRAMPYPDYLRTPEWRRRRDRALARALWCCEWPDCRARKVLEVHHKTYNRLGDELDQDLAVLCPQHHHAVHEACGRRGDVRIVVIRELMRRRGYTSIAEFTDALKHSLAQYKIPYDPHDLHDTLNRIQIDLEAEPLPPLPPPAIVWFDEAPDQIEATEILETLTTNCPCTIRTMPDARALTSDRVRELQWHASRAKALDMVLDEIRATEVRCAALEHEKP